MPSGIARYCPLAVMRHGVNQERRDRRISTLTAGSRRSSSATRADAIALQLPARTLPLMMTIENSGTEMTKTPYAVLRSRRA